MLDLHVSTVLHPDLLPALIYCLLSPLLTNEFHKNEPKMLLNKGSVENIDQETFHWFEYDTMKTSSWRKNVKSHERELTKARQGYVHIDYG